MYFALKNIVKNTNAFKIADPVTYCEQLTIPEHLDTKKKWEAWIADPNNDYAFISGIEPLEPRMRVSISSGRGAADENPPEFMHAIIADYDAPISDEELHNRLRNPPAIYAPKYIVDTFSKGKHRLVWEFESPIRMPNTRFAVAFYKVLKVKLALTKWIGGFDNDAWAPNHYYAIGRKWTAYGGDTIPLNVAYSWAAEAAAMVQPYEVAKSRVHVPMELVAAAIEREFPGAWQGDFIIGARGPRFWDPNADNQRGALVAEHGMVCFTGPKGFVSWEELLGSEFADNARGELYKSIQENYYWDGKCFWRRDPETDLWVSESKDDTFRDWHCMGVSKARKNGGPSELDLFAMDIRHHNRVFEALPFLFCKPGRHSWNGKTYLNTSDVRVLPPAAPFGNTEDQSFDACGPIGFPWLHEYFSRLFKAPLTRDEGVPEEIPLEDIPKYIFLSWLQRTYAGGFSRSPKQGQAIVLAGPVGVGKTFLVEGILSHMLGRVSDGSAHLVEGGQWTSEAGESAIMFVDDTLASSQFGMQRRFTAMLKKIVASPALTYNKKHGSYGRVQWMGGRIVIACNTDPNSLRILPDLEQSNMDKISMFMVQDGIRLPGFEEQENILIREAPYFARWLLEWPTPEWTLAPVRYRGRFGVRSYHHTSLREAAGASGTANAVLEVLRDMYEDWVDNDAATAAMLSGVEACVSPDTGGKAWEWSGRASKLFKCLYAESPLTMGKISSNQLSATLAVLSSRGFTGITSVPGSKWRIRFDENLLHPFDPVAGGEHHE